MDEGNEDGLKGDSLVNLLGLERTNSTAGLIFSTYGPSLDGEAELGGAGSGEGGSGSREFLNDH